jgi:hypothetical protein
MADGEQGVSSFYSRKKTRATLIRLEERICRHVEKSESMNPHRFLRFRPVCDVADVWQTQIVVDACGRLAEKASEKA